jgi:energy-coupling factor transporter ATP-binding protein EcfA2
VVRLSKLQEWVNGRALWVGDALHRAAFSSEGLAKDAEEVAKRVQSANGITVAGHPQCEVFDVELLDVIGAIEEVPVLCSIGPLENIDRLEQGQVLKFAQNGLTIIYGDNGSGKSGYARAARRLCTHRVSRPLQQNVFEKEYGAEIKVHLTTKTGDDEIAEHQWIEGTSPPNVCKQMTFLDTANAQVYVNGSSEILFLPPEVQCLTTLGAIFSLASEICQGEADKLSQIHGGNVFGYHAESKAGALANMLSIQSSPEELPSVEALQEAGTWEDADEAMLATVKAELSVGPEVQALKVTNLAKELKEIIENANTAVASLDETQLKNDQQLLSIKKTAVEAAQAAVDMLRVENPIPSTGSPAWKELFLHARRFAHESDVVPSDAAFDIGDPCVVCQRPLDETSRDRLNKFDVFIEDETTKAVDAAKAAIEARVTELNQLEVFTKEEVLDLAKLYVEYHEQSSTLISEVANIFVLLDTHKTAMIEHLKGEGDAPPFPNIQSLNLLRDEAKALDDRVVLLSAGTAIDPKLIASELELVDQQRLANELEQVVARRDGLANRLLYLQCVKDLNKGPVSALATKLRKELVTPELQKRVDEEISGIGLQDIPMSFATKTNDGKSFFDVALDSVTAKKAKKSEVLSEGEQRALAIACFLSDPHVSENKGAIIVDDPVTSLDHNRIRLVANRFAKEASRRNQVIIFTHNLLFYQELLRACADCEPQIPVTKCMIQKSATSFGLVSVNDEPWVAKRVKGRMTALTIQLEKMPNNLVSGSEALRVIAKEFYTDLRETWERTVEELVLGGVVERFGTDVKTQSLRNVVIDDEDYKTIFFAMKRASELSGHDKAMAKQIDAPDKKTMSVDLERLRKFSKDYAKKVKEVSERRKAKLEPPAALIS